MSWELVRSPTFVRAARKYLRRHPAQAADLFETLTQLTEDPFHSALRTHKLTGVLAGSWACSAGYDLRVIFKNLDLSLLCFLWPIFPPPSDTPTQSALSVAKNSLTVHPPTVFPLRAVLKRNSDGQPQPNGVPL